jgi:hypothetical protein
MAAGRDSSLSDDVHRKRDSNQQKREETVNVAHLVAHLIENGRIPTKQISRLAATEEEP